MNLLREWVRQVLLIEGRKDDLLLKNPDFKDQIEFFSQNDPSGKLKYIDWQLKMFKSGQALEQEIVDITNAFHRFGSQLEKRDINQYKPEDLTNLRDQLFDIEAKQEARKEKIEKRYRLDDTPDADIVYESPNWTMYHVKNKAASMKLGCNTKWCITMKDKHYFEQYDSNNVVFFFLISKTKSEKLLTYKIACAVQRGKNNEILRYDWFDAKDTMMSTQRLTKLFGQEMNEIKNIINLIAKKQQKSMLARLMNNEVSQEEALQIYHASKNNPEMKENTKFWKILFKNLEISSQLWDDIIKTKNTFIVDNVANLFKDAKISTKQLNQYFDMLINESKINEIFTILNSIDTLVDVNTIKFLMSYDLDELNIILMKLTNTPLDLFKTMYESSKINIKTLMEIFLNTKNKDVLEYLLNLPLDGKLKAKLMLSNVNSIQVDDFIKHYIENKKYIIDEMLVNDHAMLKFLYKKELIELIYNDIKNGIIKLSEDEKTRFYYPLIHNEQTPEWIIDDLLITDFEKFSGFTPRHFTTKQIEKLATSNDVNVRYSIVYSPNISTDTLKKLSKDKSSIIRKIAKQKLSDESV